MCFGEACAKMQRQKKPARINRMPAVDFMQRIWCAGGPPARGSGRSNAPSFNRVPWFRDPI
jgi:hypothetical protein